MKTKKKVITIIIPLSFLIFLYKSIFPINLKMSEDVVHCNGFYYRSETITNRDAKKINFNSFVFTSEPKVSHVCYIEYDLEEGRKLKLKIGSDKIFDAYKLGDLIPCKYTKIIYFNTITKNYTFKYKNFRINEEVLINE